MIALDIALARRLEAAEGFAGAQFALARLSVLPEEGSEATRLAGADVVFDGADSPITQTFGLGMFEPATGQALDDIEGYFFTRGAPTQHEVCPLVGVATLDLLCARGYRPIEISNVLCQPVPPLPPAMPGNVRVIQPEEARIWTEVNTRGWCHDQVRPGDDGGGAGFRVAPQCAAPGVPGGLYADEVAQGCLRRAAGLRP